MFALKQKIFIFQGDRRTCFEKHNFAGPTYVSNGEYCTELQEPTKHCATMPHFQTWGTFHYSQQMTETAGSTNTVVSLVMKMVTKRLMGELLIHPVDIPDKG